MSAGGNGNGNKTVFRPSPLQGLRQAQGAPPPAAPPAVDWGGLPPPPPPPPPAYAPSPAPAGLAPSRLAEDDVPQPATPRRVRNVLLAEAAPVLALAAGVRSGRVRLATPQFHREATRLIAAFDRAISPHCPEETRQRARYAVCATVDDIAQNLPGVGADGAEWARRSMVVQTFQENIGGDRFWQLVDDMLRDPAGNGDLIELYHACLAAGFEGRFRVMPDGRRRLQEVMARLHGALAHVRAISATELSPQWKGETAPVGRLGFWSLIALAAAGAAAVLLLIYIVLRLMLMTSGDAPAKALAGAMPDERLTLSRAAAPLPATEGQQATRLRQFLAPEIAQKLVTVKEDAQTVRVRTVVGQLFQSGSDALEPGREALFRRIGAAVEGEAGPVTIEGHADSDRLSNTLTFPDNLALSQARADVVAAVIRATLSDPSRVTAKGMGDTVPIASNDTAAGKAENRRVEVIVPRRFAAEAGQ
jgi:type IV/VI secretion system ImpK/VasF family protein